MMFSLNIGSVFVLSATVPLALTVTLLYAGVREDWVGAIFLTVFVSLQSWLLGQVSCPHCRRVLKPGPGSILHVFFWQRYLYLGGTCPHCGRAAGRWWY